MALDDLTRLKLEKEARTGQLHKSAWENTVKPFFDAKHKELYDVFLEAPTSDDALLMSIKYQANVLNMMQDNFKHYIQTGELAQKTLDEEESNE